MSQTLSDAYTKTLTPGVGIDLAAAAIDPFSHESGAAGVIAFSNYPGGADEVGVSMTGDGRLNDDGNKHAGTTTDDTGAGAVVASGGTVVSYTGFTTGGFDEADNNIGSVGLDLTETAQLFDMDTSQGSNEFADYEITGETGVLANGAGVYALDCADLYGAYGHSDGYAGVGTQIFSDATMVVTANIHGDYTSVPHSAGGQGVERGLGVFLEGVPGFAGPRLGLRG